MVRLIAHDHEPPPEDYIPRSGGLFRDSSIHDFDAIRWMTGVEVAEVYAVGSVRGFPMFAKYDDVDTAAVILTLTDGTLGVLGQTRHDPIGYDIRMEVIGSKDSVAMGLGPQAPIRSTEPGAAEPKDPWSTFLTRFESAYRAELLAFLRVVRGRDPEPVLGARRQRGDAHRDRRRPVPRAEGRAVRLSRWPEPARRRAGAARSRAYPLRRGVMRGCTRLSAAVRSGRRAALTPRTDGSIDSSGATEHASPIERRVCDAGRSSTTAPAPTV